VFFRIRGQNEREKKEAAPKIFSKPKPAVDLAGVREAIKKAVEEKSEEK
jgi:hypothetical protein